MVGGAQLDVRLLREQFNLILHHALNSYLSTSTVQLLIVIGLWSEYPHSQLLLWFSLIQLTNIVRYFVCRFYSGKALQYELRIHELKMLGNTLSALLFVTGLLWGSLAWLLPEQWSLYSFIIMLPVMGISAAAVHLSAVLRIYFVMQFPIVIQVVGSLAAVHIATPVLALIYLIYYAGVFAVAVATHRMIRRTFQLQFELEDVNSELVVQKQAAEYANVSKSRFLAAASHDLRQPLHAMEFFLGGMAEDVGEEKRRYLGLRLKKSLEGMQEMFSTLLDMSRFDAGVITPEKQVVPAKLLFEIMRLKFEEECKSKGLEFRMHPCSHYVEIDLTLIERLLSNYVSNAVKYTNQGGILLGCRRRGESLRIEVWDTGRGIPVEDMKSIYEEFNQLDNPERDRSRGVGLGLSIVEQISQLLDMPVAVRSRVEKGSVFSVDVPIGNEEEQKFAVVDKRSSEVGRHFEDISIWLIDDDSDILDAMEALLESWGCIVRSFNSPEQVQVGIDDNNRHPDIIISDVRLNNHMNGIEVIHMIRDSLLKQVSAILMTGDTSPDHLQMVAESGHPVLHKPVSSEQLQETMLLTIEVL